MQLQTVVQAGTVLFCVGAYRGYPCDDQELKDPRWGGVAG